jgi:P4 family phage/plasmid primase-like protien
MSDKPTALSVVFENIPMELKRIPRWVMWKFVEVGEGETRRWSKLPSQPNGQSAKSNDPSTWTDFLSAEQAYGTGRFDGVGFVFSDEDNLAGVDLDDCFDSHTGRFTNAALQQIADKVDGYMEVSPSGTGVKIFTRANLTTAHVDHALGLEVYNRGRYFTVTGHYISGAIPEEAQDISAFVPERTIHRTGDAFADYLPPVDGYDLHRVETEILSKLDPNCGYNDWLQVGFALHHQFSGDLEALELWERWSYGDGQVANHIASGPMSCEGKWRTFKGQGSTLRSIIFKVNQEARKVAMANGEIILDNGNPLNHAKNFLDNIYSCEEGYRLVHYADEFYVYVTTHYEVIEESTVRAKLYSFLDRCKKSGKKGELTPFNPTPPSVSAAMDAIKAITHLPNHPNTKPPIWLEDYRNNKPNSADLISLNNGLFHLKDSLILPHSLGFFTQNALPFAYDPSAQCPTWLRFLNDLWPDDQQSIDCLQEMFGYIISGDTKQQKFFNLIGPRRSGKGTINKVLVELLGQHNTVAPQLEELCDTFGLQPWLGKLLASFTDARAPERNRSAVVSQLLRIVGGDTVTVNRKNKEAWNGYLPTRIVIYSNEALQLTENSNALTGRMIVIKMTNSFYGKEDADLSNKLQSELSGIFNWAMEGLVRRIDRGGYFLQPPSGQEYLDLMQEIGNPMGTFAEDALEFDPLAFAPKDDVFNCYKHWAIKKSIPVGTELAFKRRFLASTQEHRVKADLIRDGGDRTHIYRGVRLNSKAQKYIQSTSSFDTEIF